MSDNLIGHNDNEWEKKEAKACELSGSADQDNKSHQPHRPEWVEWSSLVGLHNFIVLHHVLRRINASEPVSIPEHQDHDQHADISEDGERVVPASFAQSDRKYTCGDSRPDGRCGQPDEHQTQGNNESDAENVVAQVASEKETHRCGDRRRDK
jgi:hypothetical protein